MTRVTIYHRDHCPPCKAVLRDVVPRLQKAGIQVELVDTVKEHIKAPIVPYIVAEGTSDRVRCKGYPPEKCIQAILSLK